MRFVAIVVATALWMGAGSCANDAQNAAEAAGQAHSSLRMADDKEWLTPADEDWLGLASHYGGAYDGGERSGKAAYQSLLSGGRSSFNAVLGGGRDDRSQYDDLDAHGFYWTASEADSPLAVFYNCARGGLTLYRQPDGEKPLALSVRCVR